MNRINRTCFAALIFCAAAACGADGAAGRAESVPTRPSATEAEARILASDIGRLETFISLMERMAGEMAGLQATVKVHQNEYFTSDEHDAIEHLLFRYLVCRNSLWDMIEFHRDYETHFTTAPNRTKSFVIGYTAALHLYYFSARLIGTFLEEPMVIKKLNEAYHRSEIPTGTYDTVFKGVTDPQNLKDMAVAWELYSAELERGNSPLNKLMKSDPEYKKLILNIKWIHEQTSHQREQILEASSLFSPELRNALRHSEVTSFAQSTLSTAGSAFAAIRALTFTNVSRLKNPVTAPLEFDPGQIAEMKHELQPGDIILTYSAGYMSNVFLPGVFKHGITYVGSPEDRREAGITRPPPEFIGPKRTAFEQAVMQAWLDDGHPADLIEAVAEGVVFNSLEKLTGTKINRMVALRPSITPEQRRESLSTMFVFIGDRYDFNFDFNDASSQCCTELIYRCFNKKGPLDFPLVKRMGRQTLSADDICHVSLRDQGQTLTPVLLVESDGPGSNRAAIISGEKTLPAFIKLMSANAAP